MAAKLQSKGSMLPRRLPAPLLLPLLLATLACSSAGSPPGDVADTGDGLAYDEEHPNEDFSPKADEERQYEVPRWVLDTELVAPEIRVSLDGLSVHLFDRETGLSRVYPMGPGALSAATGESFTPTGFFASAPGESSWWNISERFSPAYFGGFPFLRLTIHNSKSLNTYGFHGPITYSCRVDVDGECPLRDREWFLVHDFVSHGCMRMRPEDIVELYYLVRGHHSVPVTIQQETELDPSGEPVSVGDVAIDGPQVPEPDAELIYGELGPRPANWDPCTMPADWKFHRYGC